VNFLEQIKSTIAHAENTQRELESQKFRNTQLETVLKILARRNGVELTWTKEELEAASNDGRCVVLGGRDLFLYGEEETP
jgi:hypothetical protein